MGFCTSLRLSASRCANFSLWLSLILQLLLSLPLSLSLSFCVSLSHSCYAELSAVTSSQDLVSTPPSVLLSPLLHPFCSPLSWVLAFGFFLLASLSVLSPVPASLLLFKGAHPGLGNPALRIRCRLFLMKPTNPRLKTEAAMTPHTLCLNRHSMCPPDVNSILYIHL